MAHVRCMWGPEDCRWYGINYDDRWIIKQLPNRDRTWNGALRCWVTPVHVLATLPLWLEQAGYTVAVIDVSRPVPTRDWCAERIARYGRCPNHKKPQRPTRKPSARPRRMTAAHRTALRRTCPHKSKTAAATATEQPRKAA